MNCFSSGAAELGILCVFPKLAYSKETFLKDDVPIMRARGGGWQTLRYLVAWLLSRLLHPVTRDCLIAAPYALQDALTYLIPTSALESRLFLLTKKSGETAAKFIINSHPKYFQKGIAEPPILCLLPEHFEP